MRTPATAPDAARRRLLDGVLLRLAGRPDAGAFILRGGVLLQHWFHPAPRSADDLDLIATFPFDVGEAERRFLPVLAADAGDGVRFDPDRTRVAGMWLGTGTPGARVHTSGTVDGTEHDFQVDITFGPFPRPAPEWVALPTAGGEPARVWACRPEAVAGHKVQALWHRGLLGWRPKDLDDLRRLLLGVPIDPAALGAAVGAYLADAGGTGTDARALFGPGGGWGTKFAAARWRDYARETREWDVPRDLPGVAAEVAGRLAPALEGLP